MGNRLRIVLKCFHVHPYSADYIFWSFGVIKFFLSFESRVPLEPMLADVAGVAHFISGHEQTKKPSLLFSCFF